MNERIANTFLSATDVLTGHPVAGAVVLCLILVLCVSKLWAQEFNHV